MNNTRYNILIVDDDMDDHFFLTTALKEVMPAAVVKPLYDGSEAMDYLNGCSTLPHLIFMDLNMTRTCGKKATGLIRSNAKLNQVPIIILTTSDGRQEKSELIALGANDFYTKPRSIEGLVKIVENVKNNWLTINNNDHECKTICQPAA